VTKLTKVKKGFIKPQMAARDKRGKSPPVKFFFLLAGNTG